MEGDLARSRILRERARGESPLWGLFRYNKEEQNEEKTVLNDSRSCIGFCVDRMQQGRGENVWE